MHHLVPFSSIVLTMIPRIASRLPYDGADLAAICAADGMGAMCCSVPVAGQAVLCNKVVGA